LHDLHIGIVDYIQLIMSAWSPARLTRPRVTSAHPRIRFAHQVLALQVGVVILVAAVGYALFSWLLRSELQHQYGQRALSVARGVAADPVLGDAVAAGDPRHVVRERAERVRRATRTLFVVVTDRHGVRLSHPNPAMIGKRVSTDPSMPLSGHEVVAVERGTLGLSARGKVPLRDRTGAVVGEVSVGFDAGDIDRRVRHTVAYAGLFTAGALTLGILASAAIGGRLKRQTLGLEPYELAELVQEREAVLHGVGEGVLAVDAGGRLSVCNTEAARLLGLDAVPRRGTPVAELPVSGRLKTVLAAEQEAHNLFAVAGDRVLVVNRCDVRHDGRPLGAVITLRDRTDLETLARELDAVRTLFDALRAQRHEYANRMHTLSGLIHLGHQEEAVEYIRAVAEVPAAGNPPPTALPDPYLQAFLSAKTAVAAEKGVELVLGESSWVPGRVSDPLDVTTVVGNLVDNALEAARLGARRPAKVEVELLGDGDDLHAIVADSGAGVPAELGETIFDDGVSTRAADHRPHGLGLSLARHAARTRNGDVRLLDPGRPDTAGGTAAPIGIGGAVFVARLPGVLCGEAPT
jgi:two-component system CitB family sensor kinase